MGWLHRVDYGLVFRVKYEGSHWNLRIFSRMITNRKKIHYLVAPLSFFILCIALWGLRQPGPDFERYLSWSKAGLSGNIFSLSSPVLSNQGLPVFQWSIGPGFLFALGGLLTRNLETGAYAVGTLFGLILWSSFYQVLWISTGKNRTLTLFALLVSFLGTHLGYYSHSHASESLALGTLSLLTWLLISNYELTNFRLFTVGALCSLLILERTHYVLYIPLVGCYAFFKLMNNQKALGAILRKSGLFFAPITVVFAITFILNHWMTGSFGKSPYIFGDGNFKSLDFRHPEFGAILFHSWHGLLPYHPVYGIALIGLVFCIFNKKVSVFERRLWVFVAASFMLHLYLQASWYCWWMGMGTFGMRGMAISSLYLIPALFRAASLSKKFYRLTVIPIVFCSLFSSILLWQGNSNYFSPRAFLQHFIEIARGGDPGRSILYSWAIAGVYLTYLGLKRKPISLIVVCCVGLSGMVTAYISRGFFPSLSIECAFIGSALAILWFNVQQTNIKYANEHFWSKHLSTFYGWVAVVFLFFLFGMFSRLYYFTNQNFYKNSAKNTVHPFLIGDFFYPEVEETYEEYLKVEGFDRKKNKLDYFLKTSKAQMESISENSK